MTILASILLHKRHYIYVHYTSGLLRSRLLWLNSWIPFLFRARGGGCEPRRGVGSPSEGRSPGTAAPPKFLFVPGNVRPNGPRVHLQSHAYRSSSRRTLGPLGRTPQDTAEYNTRCDRYTRASPFAAVSWCSPSSDSPLDPPYPLRRCTPRSANGPGCIATLTADHHRHPYTATVTANSAASCSLQSARPWNGFTRPPQSTVVLASFSGAVFGVNAETRNRTAVIKTVPQTPRHV